MRRQLAVRTGKINIANLPSDIVSKTHPRRGRDGRRRNRWHLGYLTEWQEGSGGSGWSRGSAAAWGPPLRWQTRRLEVIRRPLPCNVSALLPRRISGLVRLYLLQHGRQPLVVDIAPGGTV